MKRLSSLISHLSSKHGFTLVELLVVIAILAILTTLGITNFGSAKVKARDLSRKSDLQTIAKSLEAYINDHRTYPLSDASGKIKCQSDGSICDWGAAFTDGTTTYATVLPQDKNTASAYRYLSASGANYTLYATLENPQDPAITTFSPEVYCGSNLCNYKITSSNIQ